MTSAKFDPQMLQSQIDNLGKSMDENFREIKTLLTGYDARLRAVELTAAGDMSVLKSKVEAAWAKIDQHDKDIKSAQSISENALQSVNSLQSVARWFLGILTAAIIAILILFLTGKAEIVFK